MPPVYGLDVTDASRWEESVLKPALQILDSLSKVKPRASTLYFPLLFNSLFFQTISFLSLSLFLSFYLNVSWVAQDLTLKSLSAIAKRL